jgi:predicted  nucleic acid-binding Zn-ribbon protein
VKDVQAVVDAIATLGLTAADYEKAIEVEREYLHLVSIAAEEEVLREKMHQAGDRHAATVEEIKQAMKALEARKKEAAGLYDAARRDLERANDASCRLAKLNCISGKKLAWQLQNILQEQKEIGRKLTSVRERLKQARMDVNSLHNEYNRTKDIALHSRYHAIQANIRSLESEESKLIQQSEDTRDSYERTRLTRGIDGAASGDEIDGL